MDSWAWVGLAGAAYVSGSIPFGLLIARMKGVDIRAHGSGNIGATNVGRVLGRRFGMLCFALDACKGFVPTMAAGLVMGVWGAVEMELVDAAGWLGVASAGVLGHMFSVWLRFKGGKGVATGTGACLGVYPALTIPVVCAGLVWLAMVRATRYVGISSCVAAATLVLFVWVWHGLGLWVRLTGEEDVPGSDAIAPFLIGTGLLAGVVVFKHRGNLARMARGEEPKVGRPK